MSSKRMQRRCSSAAAAACVSNDLLQSLTDVPHEHMLPVPLSLCLARTDRRTDVHGDRHASRDVNSRRPTGRCQYRRNMETNLGQDSKASLSEHERTDDTNVMSLMFNKLIMTCACRAYATSMTSVCPSVTSMACDHIVRQKV